MQLKMNTMKNILITAICIISLGCKAQPFNQALGEVINIYDKNGHDIDGAYYKDLDNYLDQFVGTYLYTNANKILRIKLVKKTMQNIDAHFEDLIIGEYQYFENNVQIVNTIPQINVAYADQRLHNVWGNRLVPNNKIPRCPECNVGELRLNLSFIDAIHNQYGRMIVRKINVAGNDAIKIHLKMTGNLDPWIEGQPQPPTDFTVPAGEYILIKE